MKTSIYLENAEVKALLKTECKTNDLGVAFDKVDAAKGLKHDDLARAMYIAAEAGTDKGNVASLLSRLQAAARERSRRWPDRR